MLCVGGAVHRDGAEVLRAVRVDGDRPVEDERAARQVRDVDGDVARGLAVRVAHRLHAEGRLRMLRRPDPVGGRLRPKRRDAPLREAEDDVRDLHRMRLAAEPRGRIPDLLRH